MVGSVVERAVVLSTGWNRMQIQILPVNNQIATVVLAPVEKRDDKWGTMNGNSCACGPLDGVLGTLWYRRNRMHAYIRHTMSRRHRASSNMHSTQQQCTK